MMVSWAVIIQVSQADLHDRCDDACDQFQPLQYQLQHPHTISMNAGGQPRLLSSGKRRTGSKHGSFGFKSFDDIGSDDSQVLSQSFKPEGKKHGLPEQDPAEMAAELYARTR